MRNSMKFDSFKNVTGGRRRIPSMRFRAVVERDFATSRIVVDAKRRSERRDVEETTH